MSFATFQSRGLLVPVVLFGLAGGVALALADCPAAALPRGASGGDLLAVCFGDARAVFSTAMVRKADSYFHGGVDLDAHEVAEHAAARAGGKHGVLAGEAHEADEDARDRAAAAAPVAFLSDPWAWIDARVHVQEHRHLDDAHARELIPWFWAAVRADPSNLSAYEDAAYVVGTMMKNPDEAIRILDEGVDRNPRAAILDFDRGEIFERRLKNRALAAAAFERAALKSAAATDDDGKRVHVNALFYLAVFAHARGDDAAVRRYYEDARVRLPDYSATGDIGALMK